MSEADITIVLSRIQFAFTIGFHILFPTFNLGLAVFLAIMEGFWLKTHNPIYIKICRFWGKIFALTFGMGVVSGVVLSYELGTNFGIFTEAVGSVLGPLFGYEVLTAFFLEAGFLGVMLFGWNRVNAKLHFFATLMVAIGTTLSAFWIISANSWMQFPTGFEIINGKYEVTSWFEVVFNPTFLPRLAHMLLASYVTCSFVIAGVSAWYLLHDRVVAFSKKCFAFAMMSALIVVPLQIFMGDTVGLNVFTHQPIKTAAMEGLWETMEGAPLVLFAIPDSEKEMNKYEIAIPKLASLINTHSLEGKMEGLKSVDKEDRPLVAIVFFSFRIMVGIGLLMLFAALWGVWARFRGRLYDSPWLHRLCIFLSPLGFVASISGWFVAETGRQPWVVYGLMRTGEGASLVHPMQVLISLTLFIVVYGIVFSFYLFYLFKFIQKGPQKWRADRIEKEGPPAFIYMAHEE